jgi:hypothetical protein
MATTKNQKTKKKMPKIQAKRTINTTTTEQQAPATQPKKQEAAPQHRPSFDDVIYAERVIPAYGTMATGRDRRRSPFKPKPN